MSRVAAPSRRRASAAEAGLRIALHRLLRAVDSELERRRVEADLEPARGAPVDIDKLSSLRHSAGRPGHIGRGGSASTRISRRRYRDRYRLRRVGRGGFVEVALRTGSPIIPISIVGSEEIHPNLAEIPGVARLLGVPYAPITPTFPWLGPLGLIPLPSSWIIEFHPPVQLSAEERDAVGDPGRMLAVADRVRDVIQAGVYRNLERRRSVFALP